MKNYFKYIDENKTECFFELDYEFYCERAIYKTENTLINTYLTIEHEIFFLPEGNLKDSLEFMNVGSQKEFEVLWEESMMKVESDWKELKMKYKIGEMVVAQILCFYPTGIISNFGEKFNALSNLKDCENQFGKAMMYPNNDMDLIISQFDDTNRIVLLEVINE